MATILALERQQHREFEAVVVVDGSTDGTAAALRALNPSFALTVIEQDNQGRAAAVNRGVRAAGEEIVLILDDDMEADPALLSEHQRSRLEGADLVLGHVPLHPQSPPTAIAAVTGRWAERRRLRLSQPGTEVPIADLLTGQMSIGRADFERLGGFDVSFTRSGLFGGEDLDLGHRARKAGLKIVFNPQAISHQYYDVDAATYTRRSRAVARSDHELSARYPEIAEELGRRRRFASRRAERVLAPLARAPSALSWPLRRLAITLFERGKPGGRGHRLFFAVQTMERVRGDREAGLVTGAVHAHVLAYHSISDLRGDRILGEYGVPPERFAAQLDMLIGRGWRFVGVDALLRALDGRERLPRRAALITFDDAYTDLLSAGCPILGARGLEALVFVVSDRVGATNDWEWRSGVTSLELLDEQGLRRAAAQGVAIGSHSATHRPLPSVDLHELDDEVGGSADRLEARGLGRPATISYPHGEWSPIVAQAARRAGYQAAFSVTAGVVRRGANRYALPRIEIYAGDTPLSIRVKLATARWPDWLRRRLLRLVRRLS